MWVLFVSGSLRARLRVWSTTVTGSRQCLVRRSARHGDVQECAGITVRPGVVLTVMVLLLYVRCAR